MAITFDFTGEIAEQIAERDRLMQYIQDTYRHDTVYVSINRKYGNKSWTEKQRVSITYGGNELFAYRKRSRRWGSYLSVLGGSIQSIVVPEKRKSEAEIWEDSWKTALGYLEQSGLNPKYADNIRIALEVGYENMRVAYSIENRSWDEDVTDELRAIHKDLVYVNSEGKEVIKSELIWKMSRKAEIKSTYFGKFYTERIREELRQAIENKQEYRNFKQVQNYYDVSVYYNPESSNGSYSEEYRNCGNGHYYLLLDHEHALFYEDD